MRSQTFQTFAGMTGRIELLLVQMRKGEYKVDLCSELCIIARDDLETSVTHLRGDNAEEAVDI